MITSRIDAITLIANGRRVAAPPAPKSVKIELTGKCNFRCGFCALRMRDKQPTEDMDFALFKRITREMREAGVEEIGLFYLGEPFMNPSLLVQAIEYLKSIGMPYIFLTSNASIAFPDVVEACMKAGLDSLKWSVNAADDEQFAEIMGVKAKLFAQAKENIKAAWELRVTGGYKTGLYASSIMYDGEQRAKMHAMLERDVLPYVDQHYFLPLYSMGSQATEREAELGYRPTAGNQGRIGALREPLPCWSAFTEGHVRADGHVSVCCFGADARFDAGDLNTNSFMEIWHSEPFKKLRMAHLLRDVTGTMCEQCVAYKA